MPEGIIQNPQGAYGYTALDQLLPPRVQEMKASAAIAAKAVVQLSSTGQVATATTNTLTATCVGIAVSAATTNGTAQVAVAGIVTGVTAQGAIAHGDPLIRSATTAGAVAASATPAAGESVGFAVGASASGVVTVWVNPGR